MRFIAMWLPFQILSVLLPANKRQACCAVRRYYSTYNRDQKSLRTYTSFVRYIPQNELLLVSKNRVCTCICTSMLVAFCNICGTIVNMINVFYYKIFEYAHCPQQVHLRLTLYKWWGQLTINFSQGAFRAD